MTTEPPQEYSLPAGRVLLFAANSPTLLVVRDPQGRVTAAGLSPLTVEGAPGLYTVQIRVPGRQEDRTFIVVPGKEHVEVLAAVASESVALADVDTSSNGYASQQQATIEKGFAPRTVWERITGRGRLRITLWGGGGDITLRRGDGGRSLSARRLQGEDFALYRWSLTPGVYQLEYAAPDGTQHAQCLLVEKNWTTEAFFRARDNVVVGATAVVTMTRGVQIASHDDLRRTEMALDALGIGLVGVPEREMARFLSGEITEPIRALATAYAHIRAYLDSAPDAVVERSLIFRAADASVLPDESLDAAARLGERLAWMLPNSADARILILYALVQRLATRRESLRSFPEPDAGGGDVRPQDMLRVMLVMGGDFLRRTLLKIIGIGCFVGVLTGAVAGIVSFLMFGANKEASNSFLMVVVAVVSLIGGGFYYRYIQRYALFVHPPIFAEGMLLLLRMAMLLDKICDGNSRITHIALRQTGDVLWTSWRADITPHDAKQRFAAALSALERTLSTQIQADNAPITPDTRQDAALRLATGARLPLSFAMVQIKSASDTVVRAVNAVSPEALTAYFAQQKTLLEATRQYKPKPLQRAEDTKQTSTIFSSVPPSNAAALGDTAFSMSPNAPTAKAAPMSPAETLGKPTKKLRGAIVRVVGMMAIVAILAAVLFPNLSKTSLPGGELSVRQASCLQNAKEIGMAMKMYLADNDETYPRTDYISKASPLPGAPVTATGKGANRINETRWWAWLYPYAKTTNIFFCPSRPLSAQTAAEQKEWNTNARIKNGYIYNVSLSGTLNTATKPVTFRKSWAWGKESSVRTPGETLLFMEGQNYVVPTADVAATRNTFLSYPMAAKNYWYQIFYGVPHDAASNAGAGFDLSRYKLDANTAPHAGTLNIVYADGHARAVPVPEFLANCPPKTEYPAKIAPVGQAHTSGNAPYDPKRLTRDYPMWNLYKK